jgi:hypothetical protein
VQRATAQSETRFFHDYGLAEDPLGFQAGWSDCMYFFSFSLFILFTHLEFSCKFLDSCFSWLIPQGLQDSSKPSRFSFVLIKEWQMVLIPPSLIKQTYQVIIKFSYGRSMGKPKAIVSILRSRQ